MKTRFSTLRMLLFSIVGMALLSSCGSDEEDGTSYDYSFPVSGKFIGQARRTSKETNVFTIDRAPAVNIDIKNRLFWYYDEVMSVSKEYSPNVIDEWKFPGFSGAGLWHSTDVGDCTYIVSTNASNNSLTLADGTIITATSNGVKYQGVEYYNQSYFNSHVDGWTGGTSGSGSGSGSSSGTATNENVTVNMTVVKQASTNRFMRKYDVTVTATGNGFTVKSISVVSKSGESVNKTQTTSENSATFTVTQFLSLTTTIVGRVTTTSGNTYESASQSIN
jgi:hypothetical protein